MIRFGLVGCGAIAPTHAEALGKIEGACLAGVHDVVLERARLFGEKYDVPVFDSLDTMKAAVAVFAEMMAGVQVNADACADAVAAPMLLATDLADYLVLKGVPFRQAHEVIGKLVALCAQRGVGLPQLSLDDYRTASPAFGNDVFAVLDVRRSLESRRNPGGPSPTNVFAQITRWQAALGEKSPPPA